MALLIRGKTKCRLCGETIAEQDTVEMFPSGLFRPDEAAFEVNDAAVHAGCFERRPYAAVAAARLASYVKVADDAAG